MTAHAVRPMAEGQVQLTLALLKPSLCGYQPDVSAVMKHIKKNRLEIVRSARLFWTISDAEKFYAEHTGRFYFPRLIAGMTSMPLLVICCLISGPSMALALAGPDAIARWRQMLGPTKVFRGKWEEPHPVGLRSIYGISDTRNAFHGSDSAQSAKRELGLIFEGWDTDWWLERARSQATAGNSPA